MTWYKKVALHFIQLAMLNSYIVYQKDGGQKPFLGFKHDVDHRLLFGDRSAEDTNVPREENIIRLTERHFIAPIPETGAKRKPQKRCPVCYKKVSFQE